MPFLISRYVHWLHAQWPAGTVEKLPESGENGATALPGVRIVGDLTGIPLLKFSSDTGAKAVRAILKEADFADGKSSDSALLDLAIIGGGVSGVSAAIEAKRANLHFQIFEASQPFSTVANFPKAKPIYTYPTELKLDGGLQFTTDVKEALLEEMEAQRKAAGIEFTLARIERIERKGGELLLHHGDKNKTITRARRVIVAIGRSGNHRKLGCPGENLEKVFNRLFDPKEFAGKNALVVGGGDSALESAIALAGCGAHVTLSYRKKEFARPKPENVEKINMLRRDPKADVQVEHPTSERVTTALTSKMMASAPAGSITLEMATSVSRIEADKAVLRTEAGEEKAIPNDVVFSMIGREAPLDFFRRSGIPISGEWGIKKTISLTLVLLVCFVIYHWKKSGVYFHVYETFQRNHWFPFNVPPLVNELGGWFAERAADSTSFVGNVAANLGSPGFYYSFVYCLLIVFFGWRRIRRRKTPYVRMQTIALAVFQIVPLFLLPYILLPWAGHNGWFDSGAGKWIADQLIPIPAYGGDREHWRAFGLILAWPLFIWNVFSDQPLWGWLVVSFVQTFVIIPLIIFRWGKGAYCGWVCSCGALAETMGDAHRAKMPHGPFWNRFNMTGQVFLAFAFCLLALRIGGWIWPGSMFSQAFDYGFKKLPVFNYLWFVDLLWAGIIGVGLYWHFSGRVWCRFACPLAALMHIYARFSRYRIFADKKKCISCNVCTSVCHQGIDIMNFANKGMPMEDPECVRCSACVQMCPTGVLTFGRYDSTGAVVYDKTAASPVQMRERRAH